MNTVYITAECLGPAATDTDAAKMVELLHNRGYDARTGVGSSRNDMDDEAREQFEADYMECLEQLG